MKIPQTFVQKGKNLEKKTLELASFEVIEVSDGPEVFYDPMLKDSNDLTAIMLRVERKMAKILLKDKLRPAAPKDYKKWLDGFIKKGGKPAHYYDFPISLVIKRFYVAVEDFEVSPLHGAYAISILVPKKIEFFGGELGDIALYFYDGFRSTEEFVSAYQSLKS